ncbi:hypothetical protein [Luteimonas aquatica]|uniref:hypothetical protein n=1 Tax=Luteimonas aquatica TaxID=450364 RepID=UPI001F55D0B3|nr:hypothetical protein [Luteimonas aquatica]
MRGWTSLLAALAGCLAMAGGARAQSLRDSGDAAHLFAYTLKPGMEARFDAGYRRHLAWHRDKRDPLVWYGWYVGDGARAGLFVDGSFGAPFAAFDRRVDPAGDGADAGRNVTPYADTADRASYRLRRELSTGFPLERWTPSKRVQVFHYTLRPGSRARFERAVQAARQALLADRAAPPYTWYEKVVGGAVPQYMLMVAREDWKSYDAHDGGLERLAATPALQDDLAASVAEASAETWSYREDLSLIPQR